jgi:hypothetical protein
VKEKPSNAFKIMLRRMSHQMILWLRLWKDKLFNASEDKAQSRYLWINQEKCLELQSRSKSRMIING